MLANVDPAIREQVDLEKVNIEDDSELMTEYSQTIPVVLMDGEVLMESKIDPSSVRHAILARLRLQQ
jgi:predicted thioredoxin/glutaredoxin